MRRELAYYRMSEIRAYRKGSYKIHFYGSLDATERLATPDLYDLARDLSERENLAARRLDVLKNLIASAAGHRQRMQVAKPIFDKRFTQYRPEE